MNKGKEFEQDFKKSLESSTLDLWIHRPSDFGGGRASRFTNPSLCDFMVFDKEHGELYLLELKSKQNTSFSAPSAETHYKLVEAQKHIHEVDNKEDKKAAQKAYKELLRQANAHDIKYHQISELLNVERNENTKNNIHAYFILNFRKYERTFIIKPSDLCACLIESKKSSINLADAEKYGKEIKQNKIRNTQHFDYDVSEVIKP